MLLDSQPCSLISMSTLITISRIHLPCAMSGTLRMNVWKGKGNPKNLLPIWGCSDSQGHEYPWNLLVIVRLTNPACQTCHSALPPNLALLKNFAPAWHPLSSNVSKLAVKLAALSFVIPSLNMHIFFNSRNPTSGKYVDQSDQPQKKAHLLSLLPTT